MFRWYTHRYVCVLLFQTHKSLKKIFSIISILSEFLHSGSEISFFLRQLKSLPLREWSRGKFSCCRHVRGRKTWDSGPHSPDLLIFRSTKAGAWQALYRQLRDTCTGSTIVINVRLSDYSNCVFSKSAQRISRYFAEIKYFSESEQVSFLQNLHWGFPNHICAGTPLLRHNHFHTIRSWKCWCVEKKGLCSQKTKLPQMTSPSSQVLCAVQAVMKGVGRVVKGLFCESSSWFVLDGFAHTWRNKPPLFRLFILMPIAF